ncbi:MAG: hypothetical protein GQ574_15990 [Crocinitomix sp.]|nr:hypothetical protein [Crocinitomix sp.]
MALEFFKYFLFFFLLNGSYAQTDSTQLDKNIFFKNKTNDITSKTVDESDEVKVWFKEVEKPIIGHIKYYNDSTLLLNDEAININDIEKIRITPPAGRVIGIVLIAAGGPLLMAGIQLKIATSNTSGLVAAGSSFLANGGMLVGGALLTAGAVTLVFGTKVYSLDEWEVQFENKAD